jgi:hypothetical protein
MQESSGSCSRLGTFSAAYENRLNISLLKAGDFNEKLGERGCKPDLTIQRICKAARDENEIREILEAVWRQPSEARNILTGVLERNEEKLPPSKTLNLVFGPAAERHWRFSCPRRGGWVSTHALGLFWFRRQVNSAQ